MDITHTSTSLRCAISPSPSYPSQTITLTITQSHPKQITENLTLTLDLYPELNHHYPHRHPPCPIIILKHKLAIALISELYPKSNCNPVLPVHHSEHVTITLALALRPYRSLLPWPSPKHHIKFEAQSLTRHHIRTERDKCKPVLPVHLSTYLMII